MTQRSLSLRWWMLQALIALLIVAHSATVSAAAEAEPTKRERRFFRDDPASYDLSLTAEAILPQEMIADADVELQIYQRRHTHTQTDTHTDSLTESESEREGDTEREDIVVDVLLDQALSPGELFLYIATAEGEQVCAMHLGTDTHRDTHTAGEGESKCGLDASQLRFGDNVFSVSLYSTTTKRLRLHTKAHMFYASPSLSSSLAPAMTAEERRESARERLTEVLVSPVLRLRERKALSLSVLLSLSALLAREQLLRTGRALLSLSALQRMRGRGGEKALLEESDAQSDCGGDDDDDNDDSDGGGGMRASAVCNVLPDGRVDYFAASTASSSSPFKQTYTDTLAERDTLTSVQISPVESETETEAERERETATKTEAEDNDNDDDDTSLKMTHTQSAHPTHAERDRRILSVSAPVSDSESENRHTTTEETETETVTLTQAQAQTPTKTHDNVVSNSVVTQVPVTSIQTRPQRSTGSRLQRVLRVVLRRKRTLVVLAAGAAAVAVVVTQPALLAQLPQLSQLACSPQIVLSRSVALLAPLQQALQNLRVDVVRHLSRSRDGQKEDEREGEEHTHREEETAHLILDSDERSPVVRVDASLDSNNGNTCAAPIVDEKKDAALSLDTHVHSPVEKVPPRRSLGLFSLPNKLSQKSSSLPRHNPEVAAIVRGARK